jgi:hypothetical protein
MELRDELQLPASHCLVHRKHTTAGARGNIDIDVYDVVDASGMLVEQVTVREEMDPHFPFHERRSFTRTKGEEKT